MVNCSGGRLCIPFIIWSVLYSGLTLLRNLRSGQEIHWYVYVYRFMIGKSAVPFYYIIVLIQLTILTPWIIKIVEKNNCFSKLLWLVTPLYLCYVYAWNFFVGTQPRLYETFFPAWFGFYYLGLYVRCGYKFTCNGYMVSGALLLSCIEAFILKRMGLNIGFYTSQITVGSFLYSATVVGWLLNKSEKESNKRLLIKVGDCSYGIFYIHMAVLMVVGRFIVAENWYTYWLLRFAFTSIISFVIVVIVQALLECHKELLKYIGFI